MVKIIIQVLDRCYGYKNGFHICHASFEVTDDTLILWIIYLYLGIYGILKLSHTKCLHTPWYKTNGREKAMRYNESIKKPEVSLNDFFVCQLNILED